MTGQCNSALALAQHARGQTALAAFDVLPAQTTPVKWDHD